jgi:Fe-S-cluster containining protein
MSKQSPRKNSTGLSRRLRFPEDEERLPWLPALLDAYAIADTGVAIAIRDVERKQKRALACSRGCDNCCHQKDIPIYPHELIALYWYASEKLELPVKGMVRNQLESHARGAPCPFLVDHACAVHPVRPVSCRHFNVFSTPCAPGEDPYYTRRIDVLVPLADYTDRVFLAVLPFYRLSERDPGNAVRTIRKQPVNLQEYDWRKLAEVMALKEAAGPEQDEPARSDAHRSEGISPGRST